MSSDFCQLDSLMRTEALNRLQICCFMVCFHSVSCTSAGLRAESSISFFNIVEGLYCFLFSPGPDKERSQNSYICLFGFGKTTESSLVACSLMVRLATDVFILEVRNVLKRCLLQIPVAFIRCSLVQ